MAKIYVKVEAETAEELARTIQDLAYQVPGQAYAAYGGGDTEAPTVAETPKAEAPQIPKAEAPTAPTTAEAPTAPTTAAEPTPEPLTLGQVRALIRAAVDADPNKEEILRNALQEQGVQRVPDLPSDKWRDVLTALGVEV